ncbi:LolA family protein [Aquimarina algiphila]|uniref:LolA family protein n=1 Tax=Aquimarina algiphila TaxID=2047982 RepID=UPI00232B7637|nr:outer membrane lipoprotein carrier protein LolA [Aquimarina algiphila]
MKCKCYFILFLFFSNFISINAQVELSTNEQKIFKSKVIAKANSTQSMLSDFVQKKHLSIMDNAIVSEGKLAFKSQKLVKWEYTKPYKNIAIFKDDKLYVTNDGKKETLNLKSNKLFKSLNSLVVNSIKGDMFDNEQFDISYFKTDTDYLIHFLPKEKKIRRFVTEFQLKFSKTTTEVEEIKLIEPNDDYTTITFRNKQLNTKISDETFKH